MKTVRDYYLSLSPDKKRILDYAFDHQLSHTVESDDGKLIGVNLKNNPNFIIESEAGVWAVASKKDNHE